MSHPIPLEITRKKGVHAAKGRMNTFFPLISPPIEGRGRGWGGEQAIVRLLSQRWKIPDYQGGFFLSSEE
jgi:hypothetical protein